MATCTYCGAATPCRMDTEFPVGLYACGQCLNPGLAAVHEGGVRTTALDGYRDIRSLVQPGSVMEGILGKLAEELESLPVLPEVPRQVMTMVNDPLTSMQDLARVLNEDPVLNVKILKMANSAFYGGAQEIKDLHVACARLGMRGVVNVVQACAQSNLYRSSEPRFRETMRTLWWHSVAAAHAAELLAAHVRTVNPSGPFLAGLIHDIGNVVLLDLITVKYQGPVGRLRESPELLNRVLHTFHPMVGLHVVERWRLPREYALTTFFSPAPEKMPVEPWRPLTHVVSLASALAEASGFGEPAQSGAQLSAHPSAQYLDVSDDALQRVCGKLSSEVETMLDVVGAD